jgi:hypothetical protein
MESNKRAKLNPDTTSLQKSSALYSEISCVLDSYLIYDIIEMIVSYIGKFYLEYVNGINRESYSNFLIFNDDLYIYSEIHKILYKLIINYKKNELTLETIINFRNCENEYMIKYIPVQFIKKNILLMAVQYDRYILYDIKKLRIIKQFEGFFNFNRINKMNNNYIIDKNDNSISVFDINETNYVCEIKSIPGNISDITEETTIIDDNIYITTLTSPTIHKYDISGKFIKSIILPIDLQFSKWKKYSVRISKDEITVAISNKISFFDFDGILINSVIIFHELHQNYVVTTANVYVIDHHTGKIHIYKRTYD